MNRPDTYVAVLLVVVAGTPLCGQARQEDAATALAKTTQNPVSSLISLPFQLNFNSGGGLVDASSLTLNFQPVIPIQGVLKNWNIVSRTIVPYVSMPSGTGRQSGLGDIQEQLFFTPVKSGKLIWGLGPVLSFPTATVDAVVTGSWGMGAAGLVVKNAGPWVLGALVTNTWTVSDEGGAPEVHQFLIQPFLNYNFGKGWAMSAAPNITANWDAPSNQQWTLPLGVGITKTTAFNSRPMSLGAAFYHSSERPDAAPANLLRVSISFLYPPRPRAR